MKVSVSLSGGAARGAFHLGVLQALDDLHVNITALSGASIGALISASYASGVSPKKQLELFKSKAFKDSIQFNFFKNGIFKIDENNPVYDDLLPYKNFEELPIPVYVNAVDLNAGKMHTFNSGCIKSACLGSTALTPLFRPIPYQEMLLSDGGFMNNLPVTPLMQYGDLILGSNVMPIVTKKPQGIWKITKRSLFMLTQSNVVNHLDQCDIYITSEKLLRYKLFKIEHLDAMFALGYESAQEQLRKHY